MTPQTPITVGHVGWSPDYKSTPKLPATGTLIARRSAAACSPRELAEKIATRLFTNGFADRGTRLEIKRSVRMPSGPEEEVSLGGWCYQAAVDQIEKAIIEENARHQRHLPAEATPENHNQRDSG